MIKIAPKAFFFDFFGTMAKADWTLHEEIRDLITKLDDQLIPMAIVSSASKEQIEVFLEKYELDRYFQFIVSSEEVRWTKPHPECYEVAFINMQEEIPDLKKTDCWVLEDTLGGLESSHGACMHTIVINRAESNEDLGQADFVIQSCAEIEVLPVEF